MTPARSVGAAIPFESTAPLLRPLGERAVAFHALTRVMHVGVTAVSLENVLTGERSERPAQFVAGHAGALANDGLVVELERDGTVVRSVGDALPPRRLTQAIWDADRTVLELMQQGAELRPTARAW